MAASVNSLRVYVMTRDTLVPTSTAATAAIASARAAG